VAGDIKNSAEYVEDMLQFFKALANEEVETV